MMTLNERLVSRLYTALKEHRPEQMAECYSDQASFRDIAFDLSNKREIVAMWSMICATDIRTTFEVLSASSDRVVARVVDEYTFTDTGRRVRNVIESRFLIRDSLIIEHFDQCDPRLWAAMALGGLPGFLAGRFRFLRSWKARALLRDFQKQHPTASSTERGPLHGSRL